ncbi:hypothetical protein EXIGLDRAFT_725699 [Exidia glandulosa HHB12029]|uniref:Uncharacterized protein n=1 Tax=Exidia glandulosa HHB12029 TaxID=1314781 RepID=A0A165Q8K4_EXIGL|nr:hypothetical protein EXIGLDRAFT_725699 [Exidia glandulosa HHB12029]
MVDFTTYRNPPIFFDIDEIARDEVDVRLHTYGVSSAKTLGRGIPAVAPHISLQVVRIALPSKFEHRCLHVTGLPAQI